MFAWNVELFRRINASATTPHWRVVAAIAIAQKVIWLVPVWLTLSWFRSDAKGRRDLLEVLAVLLLALGFGQVIVMVWPQPRPFMIHLGAQFLAHVPDPGFPSDHVTGLCSGRRLVRCWPRDDSLGSHCSGSPLGCWSAGAGPSWESIFRSMCWAQCP